MILDVIREKAKKDYMSGLKYKDICEKYNLSMNTLKSWVKRHNWADERKNKGKKGAHKNKRGAPKGNKNAVGNDGGAPPKNKNAETHGFFSKYLPEETLHIMQEITEKDPLDILWENITIQYAAIVRAQRIMYVTEKEEMIKELKKEKEFTTQYGGGSETEWEFQFAWDRQATFLKAQSRAMAELRNMIAKYDELMKSSLATEEQQMRIEKLKAEVDKIKEGKGDTNIRVTIVDDIEGDANEG
nr:phage terminase small subunit [Tepidanaerobacter acetatoxydans]